MANYARIMNAPAPQNEALPGQIANNAGGFAWPVTPWVQLDRFLILGSVGGTYYVSERDLTKENITSIKKCIAEDGVRVVNRIVEISKAGRAPSNDPAIFLLAVCANDANMETKKAAFDAIPAVCRIGTHILHFTATLWALAGNFGNGKRKAIGAWYTDRDVESLVYQVTKYAHRDDWTHRDVLRLVRPKPEGVFIPGSAAIEFDDVQRRAEALKITMNWIVKGWPDVGEEPHDNTYVAPIWAKERLNKTSDLAEVVRLIGAYRLTHEMIPSQFLKKPEVWDALTEHMPITAMIRNLGRMTAISFIAPLSDAERVIAEKIENREVIRRGRVHPITLLAALKVYAAGHGVKGDLKWTPSQRILTALDKAFYDSWQDVTPTGKRILIGIDVSGSMRSTMVNGIPFLSANEAAATMALVTMKTEVQTHFVAFDTGVYVPKMGLEVSVKQFADALGQIGGGGTDCAAPIAYALQEKIQVDAFVIYTDNETWYGRVHPCKAVQIYREKMGVNAKLISVAMASNDVSIADPGDAGSLGCVGFDTNVPQIMADFIRD